MSYKPAFASEWDDTLLLAQQRNAAASEEAADASANARAAVIADRVAAARERRGAVARRTALCRNVARLELECAQHLRNADRAAARKVREAEVHAAATRQRGNGSPAPARAAGMRYALRPATTGSRRTKLPPRAHWPVVRTKAAPIGHDESRAMLFEMNPPLGSFGAPLNISRPSSVGPDPYDAQRRHVSVAVGVNTAKGAPEDPWLRPPQLFSVMVRDREISV